MTLQEMMLQLNLNVAQGSVGSLEKLVDELLRWNSRRNLTAINDRNVALEKHLVDSLTLLPHARQAKRMLDIGSGAGFPALPLKIVRPELEVVSVDAVGKKIDFQRHIARILGLEHFTALHERIERLQEQADFKAGFDLVTARALCGLDELVALAEPFLSQNGLLVAMKGPEGHHEYSAVSERLQNDGWSASLLKLNLPASRAERCLILLRH